MRAAEEVHASASLFYNFLLHKPNQLVNTVQVTAGQTFQKLLGTQPSQSSSETLRTERLIHAALNLGVQSRGQDAHI